MESHVQDSSPSPARPSAKPVVLVAALFVLAITGAVVTTNAAPDQVRSPRPAPATVVTHVARTEAHPHRSLHLEWL
jgi:hypothetical protein